MRGLSESNDPLSKTTVERWPNYEIKRARIARVFQQIVALVEEAGDPVEVVTERTLSAAAGRIHGRADLILRSPRLHVIVDYKTGGVFTARGDVLPDYTAQVQLYGYLEYHSTGEWPGSAYLMPFDQAPVQIPVDPVQAELAGQTALDELRAFNERAISGIEQPAQPGPDVCRFCPFSTVCVPFWSACNSAWARELVAVRGRVIRSTRVQLPVVNLEIETNDGSVDAEDLVIRQLRLEEFPQLAGVEPGDSAAIVGLAPEPGRPTYRLLPWGRLWVERQETYR